VEGTTFGRYRLLGLLGQGGMGEVWRAHDTGTERTIALKVLPPQLAQDSSFQQRFRREAHIAAGLNEPHIVPIHDLGEIDGRLYVDMRLIEGSDLNTLIARGPLQPAKAVAIIEQVSAALNAAHLAGLVHRDIKPSNILVAEHDFVYLIDFGIARSADDTALTSTGVTVGTFAYMAPERFTAGQVDLKSDIYALTCVLYECLTGETPFRGQSLEQLMAGHLITPSPRPSSIRPSLPTGFDAVIEKGMAKDPKNRYESAMELARAAREVLNGPASRPAMQTMQPTLGTISAHYDSGQANETLTVSDQFLASEATQYAQSNNTPPTGPRARSSESFQERIAPRRRSTRKAFVLVGLFIVTVSAVAAGAYFLMVLSKPGPKSVSKSNIESQISQKMTDPAGNKPESVSCPDDLKATVGAKLDCNMKVKGQTYGVNVTVTSIEGDTAKFDMVLAVDKKDVAQEISDQLEQQTGRKPDSVTCPDNLKSLAGATLRCTLVDAGQNYGVNVTVTSVDGTDVKFDIKVDNQPTKSTTTSPTP
jgi:serine/threonine protein kinase